MDFFKDVKKSKKKKGWDKKDFSDFRAGFKGKKKETEALDEQKESQKKSKFKKIFGKLGL